TTLFRSRKIPGRGNLAPGRREDVARLSGDVGAGRRVRLLRAVGSRDGAAGRAVPARGGGADRRARHLAGAGRSGGAGGRQDALLPGRTWCALHRAAAHPGQGAVGAADDPGGGLVRRARVGTGGGDVPQRLRRAATVRAGGGAGRVVADAVVVVRGRVRGGPVPAVLGGGDHPAPAAGHPVRDLS